MDYAGLLPEIKGFSERNIGRMIAFYKVPTGTGGTSSSSLNLQNTNVSKHIAVDNSTDA